MSVRDDTLSRISAAAGSLRQCLGALPESRERALALTKLDECELWVAALVGPGAQSER